MNLSIFNLFTWHYWFSQPYIAYGNTKLIWVLLFLGLILFGIVARWCAHRYSDTAISEVWRRLSNLGATMGLIGLIWFGFRQERVQFLAWRFWVFFWGLCLVWWLGKIVYYWLKRVPVIKQENAKRELMEKYLPKKK